MELTAQMPRLTEVRPRRRGRGRMRTVEFQPPRSSSRDLWDRHGGSSYALACALLGNEAAAAEALRLAMADVAGSTDPLADGEIRRRLTRAIYRHAAQPVGEVTDVEWLPRPM